jgi:hypothetical protein
MKSGTPRSGSVLNSAAEYTRASPSKLLNLPENILLWLPPVCQAFLDGLYFGTLRRMPVMPLPPFRPNAEDTTEYTESRGDREEKVDF